MSFKNANWKLCSKNMLVKLKWQMRENPFILPANKETMQGLKHLYMIQILGMWISPKGVLKAGKQLQITLFKILLQICQPKLAF